jgi:hypothetical protein
MFAIFYEKLYKEVGHTDETVMTYCYDRYPEIFSIYWGDYYSIFTNYHHVTNDYNTIKRCFINEAKNKNRNDLAVKAIENILESIQLNKLKLSDDEINSILSV